MLALCVSLAAQVQQGGLADNVKVKPFRFAQLTDVHLNPNSDGPTKALLTSIEQINQTDSIDFVLVTGDLTEQGDTRMMQQVKACLDRLTCPYYVCMGNHETTWSESGCTGYSRIFGPEDFSMYFGGVGQIRRKAKSGIAFYTAGAGSFGDAQPSGSNAGAEELSWVAPAAALKLVSSEPIQKSGVDLNKSDVVVAAGRGFSEEADLDLARALCDKIGAGLGCSRPLAEGAGWMPSETYIGVSGLMLSPKVYIAAGISGQMQHMVGANRSGMVFAINKDQNAPIFKQCDYGLVGDLKDVLPKITEAL